MLLVVPVDDALSAGEGLGLSDDLAIVISALGASVSDSAADLGIVGRQGVGVQENVIADSIRIRILAVGEGERGSSGGVLGIIDLEGDGGRSLDVTLSIIGDVSNIDDLGEEGVDDDDNVIIFSRPNTRRISRFPVVAAKICKSSNCCRNNRK